MVSVASFFLLVGVILQVARVPNVKDGVAGGGVAAGKLIQRLPETVGSWVGREESLGPSEFVAAQAERILNFDDYAYRIYRRGNQTLGVYIAYWEAGRMPTHKVASHTPDRCWTENGWRCDDMRFSVPVAFHGVELKPAQWRQFTPPGRAGDTQFVLFWHTVGDELYDYGDRFNARPHPVKWLRDSLAYAVKGSQEQFFIRLTSDQPVEEVLKDPSLAPLMEVLAELGLRLPGTGPEPRLETPEVAGAVGRWEG